MAVSGLGVLGNGQCQAAALAHVHQGSDAAWRMACLVEGLDGPPVALHRLSMSQWPTLYALIATPSAQVPCQPSSSA